MWMSFHPHYVGTTSVYSSRSSRLSADDRDSDAGGGGPARIGHNGFIEERFGEALGKDEEGRFRSKVGHIEVHSKRRV